MIRFRLNDATAVLPDEASETPLVYALRGPQVGDKTPKVGCGREQCGACRVLVDGTPAYACTLSAGAVDGRRVETAAGLDTAVRSALIEANATQCGFCLPGIVVAAEALFRSDPHPGPAAIARALDPQLCRCGSHPRILRALARLASGRDGAAPGEVSAPVLRRARWDSSRKQARRRTTARCRRRSSQPHRFRGGSG